MLREDGDCLGMGTSNSRVWFKVALIVTLAGAIIGSTVAIATAPRGDYQFFDPLVDVKAAISQRYVDAPDEEAMQLAAIQGMVESLDDPYSEYVPPADSDEFSKDLTGQYVGIGVSVQLREGWLTVASPLEDSPAFKAGVMADDRIVEIEGKSTFGFTTEQAVELLTGEPGTPVNIVIEREGVKIPMTLKRERIVTRTIKGLHWEPGVDQGQGRWLYMIDPVKRIAYLRVTQFTPTTADEFAAALDEIGAANEGPEALGGLVIDLRWNGGGVLQDAVAMADLFLKSGTIVSTKGRAVAERVESAEEAGTLPEFPIAVLINGQSASASEIFAGALVENQRAIAVGTRTFGKGLVQAVFSLPSQPGARLKITEQKYYLPSGRLLHREPTSKVWGVDPTAGFYVPLTDEQLTELVRVRRQEEVLRDKPASDQRWSEPAWVLERLKDPQLAAALEAVQGRLGTGEWTSTGQPLPPDEQLVGNDLQMTTLMRERLLRELDRLDRRVESMEAASGRTAQDTVKDRDFWADTIDLEGGEVEVKDKAGNVVAKLKITGNNLERWLIDADVEKGEAAAASPAPAASPTPAANEPGPR
jgi:carboxyl-terminal processing protease